VKVDMKRLQNKFPILQTNPIADELKFKANHGTDQITVIISGEGDIIIYACCLISPLSIPKILVDKQYFNQDQLEEDLKIFLSPLRA
jgi:hypothetical protein